MMPWPGSQQPTSIEITLPLPEPAQQPAYSSSMGWSERVGRLEVETRRLAAEVEELKQTVQQQQPVRRHWYRRVVETWGWGDDQT